MRSEIDREKVGSHRPFPSKGHADETDALIGQRIRARRGQLDLSQAKLGKAVGLTFQQIQKYERGVNRVSASKLLDIAGALGVGIGYFCQGLQSSAAPTLANCDQQPEHLLALFGCIDNPRHRVQLIELARTFAESTAGTPDNP